MKRNLQNMFIFCYCMILKQSVLLRRTDHVCECFALVVLFVCLLRSISSSMIYSSVYIVIIHQPYRNPNDGLTPKGPRKPKQLFALLGRLL
jgi:hypothetical protein